MIKYLLAGLLLIGVSANATQTTRLQTVFASGTVTGMTTADQFIANPATTTSEADFSAQNAGGNLYIGLDNSTGSYFGVGAYNAVIEASAGVPMNFLTAGTTRMSIGATGVVNINNLTASKAMATDGSNNLVSSSTTATQLGYLSSATGTTGTTSANLVFSASPTLTGTTTVGVLTASTAGSTLAGNTTINYDGSSGANLFFNRSANTVANAAFWQTGSTSEWSLREPTGASNFAIRDVVNGVDKIAITQGGGVSFPETITSTGDFIVGGANGTDTHLAQIYNRGATLSVLAANGSTGTFNLTSSGNSNGLLIVSEQNTGHVALFFMSVTGSTVTKISDPSTAYSTASIVGGDTFIHISVSGNTVTYTNESGSALIMSQIYIRVA